MSLRFGLDSTSEVPVSAHHAVGSTVALRYLSRSVYKVISRKERDNYRAGGIDLALVFEDGASNATLGYAQGKSDAEFSLKQATDILGKPPHAPLCCRAAVDYDTAGNAAATDPYFDGWGAVFGHENCGPYGGIEVIGHQAARGFNRLWQTIAWSGGRFDSRSGVYQYSINQSVGGMGVDFNHIYYPDFGQFDRPGKQPPPDPYHYLWYDTANRVYGKGHIDERSVVKRYDQLRKHAGLHYPLLSELQKQCHYLSDRIVYTVEEEAGNGPRNWLAFHRAFRIKQLWARAHGVLVAK